MPEIYPAKLSVPVKNIDNTHYEFTIHSADSVADFCKKVTDSCSDIKQFSLEPKTKEEVLPATLGELKQGRFTMNVNGFAYRVYPDLRSLIFNKKDSIHKKDLTDLNEQNTTMSTCRQVVLTEFFDKYIDQLGNEKSLTKAEAEQSFQSAITEYAKESSHPYSEVSEHLTHLRAELELE